MTFVPPMMAKPLPDGYPIQPGLWVAEQKFDGHRMCISVAETGGNLFGDPTVLAWSRDGIPRILPPHLRTELERLPSGIYDGEVFVPGHRSYGVTELTNLDKQIVVLFDAVELVGRSLLDFTYVERRSALVTIARERGLPDHGLDAPHQGQPVCVAACLNVHSAQSIREYSEFVWNRGEEGLVLKRLSSKYLPGKRPSNTWLKVKQLRSAVMRVVAFIPGLSGPFSTVLLEGEDGVQTTVKTLNMDEMDRITSDPSACIGRRLRIKFQERIPGSGAYRHPRWDRWEDE